MNEVYTLFARLMTIIYQYLEIYAKGLITHRGFYIPGEPYVFVFYNDVLMYIALFFGLILLLIFRKRFLSLLMKVYSALHILKNFLIFMKRRDANSVEIHDNLEFEISDLEYVKIDDVERAINKKGSLDIIYQSMTEEITRRTIRPANLYTYGNYTYIESYCYLRNDNRTFRLDRMRKLLS